MTRDDSWNYADILWNGIQAKAVAAAFEQLSYKEQWYLEKRNAVCMTCGRVSPLSAQSTFEDLAVDFEGTTASGAERFYRRTLDKLRLKLLESGLVHTVTLKQTECRKRNKKIAAAVYLYQADNDGEWGEIRFDFATGTAEIVWLAEWETIAACSIAVAAPARRSALCGSMCKVTHRTSCSKSIVVSTCAASHGSARVKFRRRRSPLGAGKRRGKRRNVEPAKSQRTSLHGG